jgi:serine/threonine protein phosphatase PrpC
MGGHDCGREASNLAIHCMMQSIVPNIFSGKQINGECLIEMLTDGVQWANQAVYQRNQEYSVDMGTTLTAALVLATMAYIVNVGDSRTYLYRKGEGLTQITRDHSIVARLVEKGEIAPDEIYTHPHRNQVYRGLGSRGEVAVDWFAVPVQAGDYLILCSDGLWEMVRDREIERIVKSCCANPSQASAALVKAALQGGGVDNISVIVVQVAAES